MGVIKGVIDSSLPLADEDMSWSASEATKAVKAWATSDDKIDFSKYKKAFFYVDDGGGDKQGDYHLPFATVVSGDLKAVWNGVAAAMGALNGARGGVDIPEGDKESVYKEISTYYKRFDKTPPDLGKSIVREVGEHLFLHTQIENGTIKELSDGSLDATITTADVDHQGESIKTSGIDTSDYHGTVLYGHDYQALPIGKTISMDSGRNKMKAIFKLASDIYPFANLVKQMILGGYLTDVSIGGLVTKWSDDYKTIEGLKMKEFSIVPIGANPKAMIGAKSLDSTISPEILEKEYKEFISKAVAVKIEKSLDNDEVKRHIESLKTLTAILEQAIADEPSEKDISNEVVKLTLRKTAGQVSETGQQIIKLVKKG